MTTPTVTRVEVVPVAGHDRLGARDDAVAMQYLLRGWRFDPKRPCLVRS